MLLYSSCEPIEHKKLWIKTDNIVVALQPFIDGDETFVDSKEASSEDKGVENEEERHLGPVSQRKKVKEPKERVQKSLSRKLNKKNLVPHIVKIVNPPLARTWWLQGVVASEHIESGDR